MTTYSSYWHVSRNAWNSAFSRKNITTGTPPFGEIHIIQDHIVSDTYYGITAQNSINFVITINSSVCTAVTIQSVIVHELGYVLNLDENNALLAIVLMGQLRDRTVVKTPQADDIAGVEAFIGYRWL